MELFKLAKLSGVEELSEIKNNINITGICDNSAGINEGNIFIAIQGFMNDGHKWIDEAVKSGASLVIGEKDIQNLAAPYVQVENSREVLGKLASAFYEFPSKNKKVIGLTGTNGKTTTSFFLKYLLEKQGKTVSLMGSIYNEVNQERKDTFLTTPTALTIQELLYESTDDYIIIECSSQGLDQGRLIGTEFDYALFSNLTKDHITYHGGAENYYQAKKQLFKQLKDNGIAVINSDDKSGERLLGEMIDQGTKTLSTGSHVEDILQTLSIDGDAVDVVYKGQEVTLNSPLPGAYNTNNLMLALLPILNEMPEFNLADVEKTMVDFGGVPGRIEEFHINEKLSIVIDYAHTADALEALSETINTRYKDYYKIQLLGYRAARDIEKRLPMMEASSSMADHVILTTISIANSKELPTVEEYEQLMNDQSEIIIDRVQAIKTALDYANERDEKTVIVITGKGRTPYHLKVDLGTTNDIETIEKFLDVKL